MGRIVEGLENWLLPWLPTTVCVAVALALALFGAALWHERGVRRLQALSGAHWTERARVYVETHAAVVRFRRWLVFGTLLLALPRRGQVHAGAVLRYGLVVWTTFTLLNYAIDSHWVRCASHGAQVPHTPAQAFKLSVVWWSSTWIALVFVLLGPDGYDGWGVAWALGFVGLLALSAVAAPRFARSLGWLAPAPAELRTALAQQAEQFRRPAPPAYVISSPRVFTSSVWSPGWLALSSSALELLAPHELVALSTYQFRWLHLPWPTKAWLQLRGLAYAFVPVACVPAFPEAPWAGVLLGVIATAYLGYLFPAMRPFAAGSRRASGKVPKPADSRYPLALERAHEANWQPIVYADQPRSLYELRVALGPPPDYPRPQPVSSRSLDWAGCLALALALALGLGLAGELRTLFWLR